MSEARNPYRTAPGSDPPELAGRAGELGAARYAIGMTKEKEPSNPIVFTGLRGMGKTALLRRVVRDAQAAGAVAIVGEADPSLRFSEVMRRELKEALKGSESLPVRLRTSLAGVVEKIPKLSYGLPHGAGSIAVSARDGAAGDDSLASDSLEDVLLLLNDQLYRHGRFLLIGLDELQDSPPDDLLRIIRVVHRTAGTGHPILFFGAGLPNSSDVLKLVRTYTERWAFFRLEPLSRSESGEAIDVPARERGVHWEPDAVAAIYDRSLGYPYFLQEYASASWLHHENDVVTEADVAAVTPGVRRKLDESVYDRQFAQVTPREAIYVLALHALGRGIHHAEALAESLGMRSSELSSVRAQLIKKDIVYAPARGLTEFRLPLTNEYIDRHKSDLLKRSRLGTNRLKR